MMVEINGEKLGYELLKTGKTIKVIDVEIGHAQGFLAKAIRANRLNDSVCVVLESKYGIKKEKYMPKQEPAKTPFVMDMNEQRLYEVVRMAVADALKGEE